MYGFKNLISLTTTSCVYLRVCINISNKAKSCLRTTVIMLWPNDEVKSTCSHEVALTERRSFSQSQTISSTARNQLDSGYDTDVSAPSQRLTSTSDTEQTDSDWFDRFENMDLDNDVFETDRLPLGDRSNNNKDLDNDEFESVVENEGESASNMEYETDSADDEVEELLGNGLKEEYCVSHKSALSLSHRPSAPVPQFIHSEMVTKCTCCNVTLSKSECHTTSVPCNIHFFRPIARRCNTKRRTLHNGVSESAFRRCGLGYKSNSRSLTQSKSNVCFPTNKSQVHFRILLKCIHFQF